ncbi:hypothetical protein HRG_006228 [Hirsutella rhossiliensis]|uniref:Uncharacterized protein n=1 Tax=Hirsutella rhossiliensis TaxID=111463 RepID=A0A9P8MX59_9HYPO|nr:uncharacterized protein HRG_06228 [Hirsutella rhossiliensis]KAH0963718.1 hypothetical protein HRG_06228 [Hirsutella rhossiliensis]
MKTINQVANTPKNSSREARPPVAKRNEKRKMGEDNKNPYNPSDDQISTVAQDKDNQSAGEKVISIDAAIVIIAKVSSSVAEADQGKGAGTTASNVQVTVELMVGVFCKAKTQAVAALVEISVSMALGRESPEKIEASLRAFIAIAVKKRDADSTSNSKQSIESSKQSIGSSTQSIGSSTQSTKSSTQSSGPAQTTGLDGSDGVTNTNVPAPDPHSDSSIFVSMEVRQAVFANCKNQLSQQLIIAGFEMRLKGIDINAAISIKAGVLAIGSAKQGESGNPDKTEVEKSSQSGNPAKTEVEKSSQSGNPAKTEVEKSSQSGIPGQTDKSDNGLDNSSKTEKTITVFVQVCIDKILNARDPGSRNAPNVGGKPKNVMASEDKPDKNDKYSENLSGDGATGLDSGEQPANEGVSSNKADENGGVSSLESTELVLQVVIEMQLPKKVKTAVEDVKAEKTNSITSQNQGIGANTRTSLATGKEPVDLSCKS